VGQEWYIPTSKGDWDQQIIRLGFGFSHDDELVLGKYRFLCDSERSKWIE
jgi:hypothetical protein